MKLARCFGWGLGALVLVSTVGCESPDLRVGEAASSTQSGFAASFGFRAVDYAMPTTPYCLAYRDWDPELIAFEAEVVERINDLRAQGLVCGDQGSFPPAPPLKLNSALNCAARAHSSQMRESGFFDHIGPEGQNPGDRIDLTGYPWRGWGENIALGFPTPEAVVQGWRNSEGHCVNFMRASYNQIGMGALRDDEQGIYWTQVLATGPDLEPLDAPLNPEPTPLFGGAGALLLGLGLGRALWGARRSRRSGRA